MGATRPPTRHQAPPGKAPPGEDAAADAGPTETLYQRLVDDDDARACRDIPDEACRVVPQNFLLLVASGVLSKLADELSNPKTVLAWLLSALQAPAYLVGLLVPIRESGSMLPQLLIGAWVRRFAVRKGFWVAGAVAQAAALIAIGVTAMTLSGAAAGWAVIGLLIVFSLARGFCSVAHKDVLGKTVPKARRGRLGGLAAGLSGPLALVVGLYLLWQPAERAGELLLPAAGALLLLAALLFARVDEQPGATEGGVSGFRQAWRNAALLVDDALLRRFVLVRSLLLVSALSAPYLVVLAGDGGAPDPLLLGTFIVANGLATSLSAPFWGRRADLSSRGVMTRAALLASALALAVVVLELLWSGEGPPVWVYALAFFLLGIAHSGVRLGRKTYIVDMAAGNRRTDYVTVSNSAIGVILLLTGVLGVLAGMVSVLGVVAILGLLGLLGAALATRLPEVE